MNHYGKRYHLTFNDKTKVVVTGSKHDMAYYKEMSPWTLNGKKISVVDENEHLGLVVSGLNEEQKNVDKNIVKYLFALHGQAFAYKCMLPLLYKYTFGELVTFQFCYLVFQPYQYALQI